VRDLLRNPKYTGYMVWNRRAMRSRGGKVNPIGEWIWSSRPTHEPLVSVETFTAAFTTYERRERSRSRPGPNSAHPQTRRSYPLRTYVSCATNGCGRRMFGKLRDDRTAYYTCQPAGSAPDGHPKSLWVREEHLLAGVFDFVAHHIFGPDRHALLTRALAGVDAEAERGRQHRLAALRRRVDDLDARRRRLLRNLELAEDERGELARDVTTRLAELRAERDSTQRELADLERQPPAVPSPRLLDALPIGPHRLAELPEPELRRLFEAFRLEIRYDRHTGVARCRVTLTAETQPAVLRATGTGVVSTPNPERPGHGGGPHTFPSVTCPRWDSNPHCMDFESIVSAVGLRGPEHVRRAAG
jgi:site-specific DNA recombinase